MKIPFLKDLLRPLFKVFGNPGFGKNVQGDYILK